MRRPLVLRLLSLVLSRDDEREIGGDLEENYEVRVERHGRWYAQLWLWKQTLGLPLLFVRLRFEGLHGNGLSRDPRGDSFLRARAYDLGFALRSFVRTPGFSSVTVVTLAVGIAANTSIYSVVDAVLIEGLPYPESDRLVYVDLTAPGLKLERIGTSPGLHLVYTEHALELESYATYGSASANISGEGDPIRAETLIATPSIFDVLAVRPALGRGFTLEEGLPGGPPVTILSHGLWASRFGSDPTVLGSVVLVEGVAREIVGVMPEGFGFPVPSVQLILPLAIDPASTDFGGFRSQSVARLVAGSTPAKAQRELNALFPRVSERYPRVSARMLSNSQIAARVKSLKEVVVGPVRSALWVIMGTVGFVLMIACANVGNLFLARAESRRKEVAVRTAMGGGTRALFWQFAMESGLLAVGSGVLGMLLAFAALQVLVANAPGTLPRLADIGMDGSVIAFTVSISLGAAFLFGTLPLMRHASTNPAVALRGGSRGSTSGPGANRTRQLLVSAQLAFALVLLVGAGLMLRSFQNLVAVDLGFEAEDVLTFRVALPRESYPDDASVARFHMETLSVLEEIPGVSIAGAASELPLGGRWEAITTVAEDSPVLPTSGPDIVQFGSASPNYFRAMGVPLLSGRAFEWRDMDDQSPRAIITRSLAERLWPDENPVGRRLKQGVGVAGEWSTIIGVVEDTPSGSLADPPVDVIYYHLNLGPKSSLRGVSRSMAYTLKSAMPSESLVSLARTALRNRDPNIPMADVRRMEGRVADARGQMAFTMLLLSIAAGAGLMLGAIGIYGVISYVTNTRTREIGVRMALGAQASSVRTMVLRQGASVAFIGVLVGLMSALALTRFMSALLFEVSRNDPLTYGAVAALIFGVSMLATFVPAHRASRTAPLEALREN